MLSPTSGPSEIRWRVGLRPTRPQMARGNPNRAPAVVRVRDRDHARGDRCGGAAARPSWRALGVPGISRRPVGHRLGGRQDAQLRRVRLADRDQAGALEPLRQIGVDRGAEVELLEQVHAEVKRLARQRRPDVLEQERDTPERPLRERVGGRRPALLVQLVDDRVQPGVELLDSGDRRFDELRRRRLAAADELRLGGRVHGCEFPRRGHGGRTYRSLSSPTVTRSGRSATSRTASRTPGMNERRSIESWRMVSVCPSPPKITSWWATSPGSRIE